MKIIRSGLFAAVFGLCLFFGTLTPEARADGFSDGAQKFIASLADKAEGSLLSKNITLDERTERFRNLMLESFDLKGVGKWVLGRYWRRASSAERANYLKLFEEFIIATYTKRFKAYTDAKLQINGTTSRKNSAFVNSQINRDSAKPIRIVWRVNFSDGRYQIIDIVVEGVSWIQTQRSEFVSVIRNSSGKVSGLIDALDKKITNLKASTS
ncbi:MAG: ABC transporter substrate-binding protein [Rhodospirillaceae bacterium]|jgi:phospholipid transport system substrate-binding protein|nr:ABC transporter substrate-binding protein [Rhodospirillaceae bacterium]MBT4587895.1 ABC transporter substrate-binding protein [Rhodospirillaceae bacterium]MBT5940790.1 ABC transporter substrate-binding protein [Rhodospirillaceae bacterium]MBT7266612.1 ABC transporter substrate-binding protein [Rhodospirillaceae bacterium]